MKKVFTKLDLYLNIWINKGNEQKAMFTTLEELFEPMIMFFRLTNSLVIFQMMMNKILQDLINTREVASFIDNVIVETEKEKEHDEVVEEEVVKRLAENNLYVKLEKYKQCYKMKVRTNSSRVRVRDKIQKQYIISLQWRKDI